MRVPYRKMGLIIIGSFTFGILLGAFSAALDLFAPANSIPSILSIIVPTFSLLLIVLAGFLFGLTTSILPIIEVVTSKNGTGFKILWILVLFFLPLLGFITYFFVGRKELR